MNAANGLTCPICKKKKGFYRDDYGVARFNLHGPVNNRCKLSKLCVDKEDRRLFKEKVKL